MSLRFGTDGVRGLALTELTLDYVTSLGRAAAVVLGPGPWIIGRDTRESSPSLESAFVGGLRRGGAEAESIGVMPTPALAYLSKVRNQPAAMITASHNPWHDNGVKIFAGGGIKLSDVTESLIEAELTPISADVCTPSAVDVRREYVEHLVALFPPDALAGMNLVLDCANGAMSGVAEAAAIALGAQVQIIHAEPNGRNINDRCGATSPASLAAAVVAASGDLGLAFDGDGDRVIAVDEHGTTVDGDRMIALAAMQLRDEGHLVDNAVVVTVMSNLGFHRAMERAGLRVVTTAVGDRYVLEALAAGGYSLGGEQSGHIIYSQMSTTGDGLLAGLRLAEYAHDTGTPLSKLAGEVMVSYPQVLVNVRVAAQHPNIADELTDEIAAAESALGGHGRILLRPSGTEPLIRVMVEASTADLARATADDLADVVRKRFA